MEESLVYQAFRWHYDAIKTFLFGMFFFYFFSHLIPTCGKGSKPYQYAHSLTEDRLSQIHQDFQRYAEDGIALKRIRKKSPKRPMEFDDLNYTKIIMHQSDIEKDRATLRLSFCMDESIDLELEGIRSDSPVIKLVWGELERTEEVLWQKNGN